jgi:hypothetical protein
LVPSSLSRKILQVQVAVALFDIVIPITIDSRAVDPPPAGTPYMVVKLVPMDGVQILLKSLAILLCYSYL